jgi:hypothetical protein
MLLTDSAKKAKSKYRRSAKGIRAMSDHHRLEKYGITKQEYDLLIEIQNGCCAICGQPEHIINKRTQTLRPLSVDHCHITGHIRALLCHKCNRQLGIYENNYHRFTEYLRRHS